MGFILVVTIRWTNLSVTQENFPRNSGRISGTNQIKSSNHDWSKFVKFTSENQRRITSSRDELSGRSEPCFRKTVRNRVESYSAVALWETARRNNRGCSCEFLHVGTPRDIGELSTWLQPNRVNLLAVSLVRLETAERNGVEYNRLLASSCCQLARQSRI